MKLEKLAERKSNTIGIAAPATGVALFGASSYAGHRAMQNTVNNTRKYLEGVGEIYKKRTGAKKANWLQIIREKPVAQELAKRRGVFNALKSLRNASALGAVISATALGSSLLKRNKN